MRLLLLVVAVGCSGKSQQAPAEDAKKPPIVVDAAVPPDARERFVVTERKESFETFVTVRLPGANCPGLDFRPRSKTIRIERCRGMTPLSAQIETLRDMVAHVRTLFPLVAEDVTLVGSGDFYSYPEYAKRLVEYAQRVPYNPEKGMHDYIVKASAAEDLTPELNVIFQRKAKLKGVEKCTHGRPSSKGEVGEWLRAQGFKGNKLVPVGCSMAWFELER